jgi:hypothetical protein
MRKDPDTTTSGFTRRGTPLRSIYLESANGKALKGVPVVAAAAAAVNDDSNDEDDVENVLLPKAQVPVVPAATNAATSSVPAPRKAPKFEAQVYDVSVGAARMRLSFALTCARAPVCWVSWHS